MPSIVYTFEGDVEQLRAALAQTSGQLKEVDGNAQKMGDGLDKAGAKGGRSMRDAANAAGKLAAGLLAAGAAAGELIQRAADLVNDLNDLSAKTGVAAETLNGLALAFEGSGQDASALDRLLKTFPQRLADTRDGTGKAKRAFDELGVAVTDSAGNLRSSDEVLREIVAKLQAVEDPTLRAALATDAFGTSGTKLIQALGTTDLEAFTEMANRFGTDVGPEASKAAADWQREMASLKNLMRGALTDVLSFATGGIEGIRNFQLGFVAAFAAIKAAVGEYVDRLRSAANMARAFLAGDFSAAAEHAKQAYGDLAGSALRVRDATAEAAEAFLRAQQGIAGAGRVTVEATEATRQLTKAKRETQQVDRERDAEAAARAAAEREEAKQRAQAIKDQQAQLRALMAAEEEARRVREAAAAAEQRRIEEIRAANMENISLVASSTEQTAQAVMGLLDMTNERSRSSAQALFRLSQAGAVGRIAISTAEAVMKVTAQTGVGAALAVPAVIAAGSAQAAAVLAQKPPTFDVGGIIGGARPEANRLISAQTGEAVISRAGTARLGREGVQALNSGNSTMGETLVVVNQYQHRSFEAFLTDAIRRPSNPVAKALSPRRAGMRRLANG